MFKYLTLYRNIIVMEAEYLQYEIYEKKIMMTLVTQEVKSF